MTPLVDIHCHLLAGMDDGPGTVDEAVEMCRIAWDEGTRLVAATAHMNEHWPEVTPARIRTKTKELAARLREIGLALSVYPSAEVTVRPGLDDAWDQGELVGVADGTAYMLIEFPDGRFLDLRDTINRLRARGVRPILAHPERQAELLHDAGAIEALIHQGCLVQVSSESVSDPLDDGDARTIKRWVKRGVVHLVGSDGHSVDRRPPSMAAAYRQIAAWAGGTVADRVCSLHGLAVLEGRTLRLPKPEPAGRKKWFSFLR